MKLMHSYGESKYTETLFFLILYLFKAVGLEDFKTGDIQHTNEGHTLLLAQDHVDLLHDPEEKPVVDLFSHQSHHNRGERLGR